MNESNANWYIKASLFLVLDRQTSAPRTLQEVTQLAIRGGVDAIVLRMIDCSAEEIIEIGKDVGSICREGKTPFILSHNPELAEILKPDAVHLGRKDGTIEDVRKLLPKNIKLGYSAHSVEEAKDAINRGADYLFLGPIFPTPSKLKYGNPLGVYFVSQIPESIKKRTVFIGGIDTKTLPELILAGGRRIAVIRAICSAKDIVSAARRLKDMLSGKT